MFSLRIVRGADLAEGVQTETQLPETFTRFGVGRDPANHWPIPDRTLAISARHCEFVAAGSRVLLRDLSTNGTFVNGAPQRLATEHVLKDGDRIELGPYTIQVHGLGAHAGETVVRDADVTVHLPPPPLPARQPSVEATTPLRGGDPAAMLAALAQAPTPRMGLTEILRNAQPAEESKLPVTKIRMAPKPGDGVAEAPPSPVAPVAVAPAPARPTSAPFTAAPVTAPVTAAPAPVRAAANPVDPLLAALAQGLGLHPDTLAGRDPAQAALQVAQLARAGVIALRQLLEQQAQARRQLGSHAPALVPVREISPLRRASSTEAALVALLAPAADGDAALQRTGLDLAAHQRRLLDAFRGAAQRLGDVMAPAALEKALGERTGMAPAAQLWELYTMLWHDMGLAPGLPWQQGFIDAALLHLATAYDEHGPR